jgi:Uma2 family endonuclease
MEEGGLMSTATTPVTPDELLRMQDGEAYELVDGELVEREMGAKAAWVAGKIHTALNLYSEGNAGGWAFPDGTGIQCFPCDPGKVRRPDACYIVAGRFERNEIPDGFIRLAPDLVIEVVSPNDSYYEVEQKVGEYLEAGVRLVWVIDPSNRKVKVYRNDGGVIQVDETAELSGEDVLPGFNCRVSDLLPTRAV